MATPTPSGPTRQNVDPRLRLTTLHVARDRRTITVPRNGGNEGHRHGRGRGGRRTYRTSKTARLHAGHFTLTPAVGDARLADRPDQRQLRRHDHLAGRRDGAHGARTGRR